MPLSKSFTGTSSRGSVVEALAGAVTAATQGLKADRFTYTVEKIGGAVGRVGGSHELTITIVAESSATG